MARSAPIRIWQSAELVDFAEDSPSGFVRRFPLKWYWRELCDQFVAANIAGSECVPQPRGAGESSEVFRKQAGGRGGWQPFAEGEEVVFFSVSCVSFLQRLRIRLRFHVDAFGLQSWKPLNGSSNPVQVVG